MARPSIRDVAMTAAERQQLERERNRRARQALLGLQSFSLNAVDWEQKRMLSQQEILGSLYMLTRWAVEGPAFVSETRLTLPPDRRAFTANAFDRFNIDLPFCRSCGDDLVDDASGGWQRCKCTRRTRVASSGTN
jgi:hypothetical protein